MFVSLGCLKITESMATIWPVAYINTHLSPVASAAVYSVTVILLLLVHYLVDPIKCFFCLDSIYVNMQFYSKNLSSFATISLRKRAACFAFISFLLSCEYILKIFLVLQPPH